MKKTNIKRLCTLSLMIALAFAFSYLESLIPFNFGIPGIKLGIANLVVIVALYTMNAKDALFISIIRILLSGLAFSGPFAMIYSLIGGLSSSFLKPREIFLVSGSSFLIVTSTVSPTLTTSDGCLILFHESSLI